MNQKWTRANVNRQLEASDKMMRQLRGSAGRAPKKANELLSAHREFAYAMGRLTILVEDAGFTSFGHVDEENGLFF
ncbi:hypothetical protein [Haloglycomyces albus]|uniref:hypothetical protein n=1 Tax=Haloglycomyces albus TaxID=526067 RepID=UPI00046C9D37|nr:hypothetical protein [Haloglycomyces albus]